MLASCCWYLCLLYANRLLSRADVPDQTLSQDGNAISASERIVARQSLQQHTEELHALLAQAGVDVDAAGAVEDDSLADQEVIPETG